MSKTDLWAQWRQHYSECGIDSSQICTDGIVDSSIFAHEGKKVLFVLRETNGFAGGDLCGFLRDGPRYQMWHTVARWATGIQQGFPLYDDINKFAVLQRSLRRCAAINLKKASGGSSANPAVINAFAFQDRALLRKQISEIEPEIIVACGTFDPLVWLLEIEFKPNHLWGNPAKCESISAWVIPWRHPGRANNRKTYSELGTIVARIPSSGGM